MDECSCPYCYNGVCFHPLRGDETGLGVPCDGCQFSDLETENVIMQKEDPLATLHLMQQPLGETDLQSAADYDRIDEMNDDIEIITRDAIQRPASPDA